jgi:hypothetical protein
MKPKELELYSDFLIASCGKATAAGLADALDQEVSHDQVTNAVYLSQASSIFRFFSEILLCFFDRLLCFGDTLSKKSPEKHKKASIS